MASIFKITKKGKAMFLAYDQGMEHGPSDFDDKNVDPNYIIDIAKKGKYNAIIFQRGIAEKYQTEIKKSKVPLIVKLNGKSNLYKGEPYSPQICTVEEAIKLGAKAVGYTIYLGSQHESKMFKEFENIKKEADKKNIPTIIWMYPRGKNVKNKPKKKLMAYATRIALELGADMVKINYHGNIEDLKWAIKSAGKTKVLIAGGSKINEKELLKKTKEMMQAGATGIAIGRNVWQNKNPIAITNKLRKIIFK